MIYIGIDPGLSGGIGIIDENEQVLYAMPLPVKYKEIDARALGAILNIFQKKDAVKVVVEKVGSMPGQSVVAMFTFGKVVGEIIAVLKVLQIPYIEVQPQQWKKTVLAGLPWKADVPRLELPKGLTEEETKKIKREHNSKKARAKKDAKLVSAKFVEQRWPTCDIYLGKKNPHDGITDALCMALYGKVV